MARAAKGLESIEQARAAIAAATTVEQLRQAQALVLPLEHGLSLEATARMIGLSVGWTSRLRNAFLRGEVVGDGSTPARGGRHHANFTPEQERELLKPVLDRARTGGVLVVPDLKPILEAALGRPMALSTVYNLLHRHGWRKLAPDKQHPQSDAQAQQGWRKTPRRNPPASPRRGSRGTDHADVPGRGAVRTHQRCASVLGPPADTAALPGHAHPRIHVSLCRRGCAAWLYATPCRQSPSTECRGARAVLGMISPMVVARCGAHRGPLPWRGGVKRMPAWMRAETVLGNGGRRYLISADRK